MGRNWSIGAIITICRYSAFVVSIDLSGRIAIVTGGTGELGRAMVRTLAKAGADVAIHYHRAEDKAVALAAEVSEFGVKAIAVTADLTDSVSVAKMAQAVRQGLGEPSIVVANAVVQYDWKSILDQDEADFESQFESAAMQLVRLAKEFAPAMKAAKSGRFVVTNTECAMQCGSGMGAYAMGKRALDGAVRVLAKELGPDQITVNQVAPGWMQSDRIRASDNDVQEGYRKNVPMQRNGTDQDIANAVLFYASDLSSFVTGTYLPVSGGTVMPGI